MRGWRFGWVTGRGETGGWDLNKSAANAGQFDENRSPRNACRRNRGYDHLFVVVHGLRKSG